MRTLIDWYEKRFIIFCQSIAARIEANPAAYLAAIIGVTAVGLTFRYLGLPAQIFADETSYSLYARHLPVAPSTLPSYLFYAVFRTTNVCGDAFLNCARLYNACFFAFSVPFIYLVAKHYVPRWLAVVVAALAVWSPIDLYAWYFMPESMYFFGFWVLTWFILTRPSHPSAAEVAIAGAILGALANVKFHATFLAFGVAALYLLPPMVSRRRQEILQAAKQIAILAVTFLLTKYGLEWGITAAKWAVPGGNSYVGFTNNAAAIVASSQFVRLVPSLASWHGMAVVVLYGLPLLLLILPRGALRQDDSSAFAYSRLQLYLAILLVELVAIVVLFNARTTGFGPYEVEGRLSLRYYNFLFPLFLIIVAGEAVQARKGEGDRRWARGVAFALAAFALVAGYVLPHVYAVTSADSPELSGIFWSRWSFRLFAVLAAALLALWAFRPRASAVWYLAVFFPLITVVAQIDHSREAKRSLQRPSLHATAGKFAKGYLGQNADEVTVVTSDEAGRYDARFYLDAPEVAVVPVSPGAPVHRSDVNANHPWVLVIGDHPLTFKPHQVIYRDGFTLAQAYEETVYDARLLTTPALTVEGATATPRGWVSTAEMIRLKLDNPLPKRFLLIADMSLTGARGPGMVDITIGQEKRSVGLPSASANTALEFSPGPGLSSIEISVSASVASAGQGDGDKPGLRVRSIRIRNLTGE